MPNIKEIKAIKEQIKEGKLKKATYSAFDNYLSFPKYTQKVREKNIAAAKELISPFSFISTLRWEMGLRNAP